MATVCTTSLSKCQNGKFKFCSSQPKKAGNCECKTGGHAKYCCVPCNGKESTKGRVKIRGTVKTIARKKPIAPRVLTRKEYEQFRMCGDAVPEEDREQALKADAEKRERLVAESMARKEEFRKLDMERPREKSEELAEIEEEARKRTGYVLERARNMRLEQQEEIQKCNRIILETKCRAVRDAQLAERKLMETELEEEEKRLNDAMENERRWAIKEELRKEQQEIAKKLEFANSLKGQIRENEEQRLLDFARKQEESRLINLSNIAWQQSEIAKLQNREADFARVRQEIAEGNKQLKHLKAMEEQENIIVDLRIREYQMEKLEREARLAEERRLEKRRKDEDKARVASQTLRDQDTRARIEELTVARIQEEVEREWRQKEKEEALRRARARKSLAEEREKQIDNKRIMQAIEIERERREFEKIVRVQKEAFCREQKELEKKQRQTLKHRSEILKQVNEKERKRIEARQKMFQEGLAIRTETEVRKKQLREAMEKKCDEMRSNKVPDIYINEVKRMIENIH